MIKKLNNMSYCIRTMAKFNVRTDINIFYHFTIDEVLRYCLVGWYGKATKADIQRIDIVTEGK